MAGKRNETGDGLNDAITVKQERTGPGTPADPTTRSGKRRNSRRLVSEAEVDAYLAALPIDQLSALQRVRKIIKELVPEAREGLRYQVPTFTHHGPLVGYSASRKHCSFFVMSRAVMDAHKQALAPYYLGPGTLRFSDLEPIPTALLKLIVQARARENEAKKASGPGAP